MRRHWTVRNIERVVPVGKGNGGQRVAAGPEHGGPGGWARAESMRRARRRADLSQRALAERIGVSPSTIARAEIGDATVSLAVIEAILAEAGLRIVLVDATGEVVPPMRADAARNNGGSRYPAHLDAQLPPPDGPVFGHRHDRPKPRLSYHHRYWRDEQRARLGVVPWDHSSEFEFRLLNHRGRLCRRPAWVIAYERGRPEPEPCECGPECETYCLPACPCQCEPVGCDVTDILELERRQFGTTPEPDDGDRAGVDRVGDPDRSGHSGRDGKPGGPSEPDDSGGIGSANADGW